MYKPKGKIGPIRATAGATPKFCPVHFPSTKADTEKMVIQSFLPAARHHYLLGFEVLGEPSQNPEDDLDFTLATNAGKKYLELQEITHIPPSGGYAAAPAHYDECDFGQAICELILCKSQKYRQCTPQGIVLLTYITDWRFSLSDFVMFCTPVESPRPSDLYAFWSS